MTGSGLSRRGVGRLRLVLLPLGGALAGSLLSRRLSARAGRALAYEHSPLRSPPRLVSPPQVSQRDVVGEDRRASPLIASVERRMGGPDALAGGGLVLPLPAPSPYSVWLFLGPVLALMGSVATGWLLTDDAGLRIAIAASVGALLLGVGLLAPSRLLLGLVAWLAALGLLRRLVTELGSPVEADPLLLVGPLAMAVLVVVAAGRGAFRQRTVLGNAVLALSLLAIAGAFNPVQGSLLAGVAGLLFLLVPMLGFWIGRGLCDDKTLTHLLAVIAGIGVLVALYGLAQTFRGFAPWDDEWVRSAGYQALQVYAKDGEMAVRPFSTFSAASEYAFFAAIALFVWLAFGLRRIWAPFAVAAVALLGAAVLYQSSRGIVFTSIGALVLMAAAWARIRLRLALVAAALAFVLLPTAVAHFAPPNLEGSATSPLLVHQIEGLADPLDPEASTLPAHISLLKAGLQSVESHPFGRGTGTISIAGEKFGGTTEGTETDPSNAAVALGIPGVLAYLVVAVAGLLTAYRVATVRRDPLGLLALGLVGLTGLQWLNGGQYAVAFLPWLLLGWADRTLARLSSDHVHVQ